jgi:hypothetical protein
VTKRRKWLLCGWKNLIKTVLPAEGAYTPLIQSTLTSLTIVPI